MKVNQVVYENYKKLVEIELKKLEKNGIEVPEYKREPLNYKEFEYQINMRAGDVYTDRKAHKLSTSNRDIQIEIAKDLVDEATHGKTIAQANKLLQVQYQLNKDYGTDFNLTREEIREFGFEKSEKGKKLFDKLNELYHHNASIVGSAGAKAFIAKTIFGSP